MIKAHNPNNLPTIDYRDLIELQPNSFKDLSQKNFDKLSNSFNVHGFITPYFVWKDKGKYFILDGHQRSRVLSTLEPNGLEVPYILIEAKNKQEAAKKLLAIDSRYGKRTAEGEQEFLDIFEIEQGYIEDVAVLEFEFEEAEEEIEAEEDDFDEAPPEEPITVLGDLYEIGWHRLLCGDSTDSDQVAKLMNGEKADMVFTDPPYGIAVKNTKGDILGDENLDVFEECMPNILLSVKESTHAYIFFGSKLAEQSLLILNKYFKQYNLLIMPITNQTQPYPEGYFSSNYEICYFTNINGVKKHNSGIVSVSETTKKDNRYNGDGFLKKYYALSEQPITEHNANVSHPTQKNVKGIAFYVLISSNENDLVLDLFLGSGSTMVASHQLKRKCYGMELDCRYADVIVKRMLKLDKTLNIKKNGIDETEKWLSKINEASDEEE